MSLGLILIDTENHDMARYVLNLSVEMLEPKHVLVFSDVPLISGCQHIEINKIEHISEYNKILIKEAVNFLQCDRYLVIQYDGFPLDNSLFSSSFLSCDYIGAIWPNKTGAMVGNGGFSLRSKKLFEAVAEHDTSYDGQEPEDLYICCTLRQILELERNVEFAKVEIARQFSFEQPFQPRNTFGFHGVFNLPWVFRSDFNFLLNHLNDRTLMMKRNWLEFGANFLTNAEREVFLSLLACRFNNMH